ncbi:hypothetical protein MOPEL_099_00470 [Mobilicoccus pelagius NBRC 104925]|uniref:Uncharacterized protein n=1 Tax=Mobilicoccus pelagius NBRC 104925 TaxID=1089455 RepID=H5UU39_9MICO|nr:hypothetical protein MOPEL_099_00470 [Mobilicoccus pelagius NBRC 104925]
MRTRSATGGATAFDATFDAGSGTAIDADVDKEVDAGTGTGAAERDGDQPGWVMVRLLPPGPALPG